jgi:hypothetical protein
LYKFQSFWSQWHQSVNGAVPDYPRDMCSNPNTAPLGNGGLALRSRYWMRRVIRYCPQPQYSGLTEQELNNAVCQHKYLDGDTSEDVYYGLLLRGLFYNDKENLSGYVMPTILEASLFSTESKYFQDHCKQYSFCSEQEEETMVKKLWWSGIERTRFNHTTTTVSSQQHHMGWDRYQRLKSIWIDSNYVKPIVPIGYHSVYKFPDTGLLTAYDHLVEECPHLPEILSEIRTPPRPN